LALADPRPMSLKEKQRMTQFILRPRNEAANRQPHFVDMKSFFLS